MSELQLGATSIVSSRMKQTILLLEENLE